MLNFVNSYEEMDKNFKNEVFSKYTCSKMQFILIKYRGAVELEGERYCSQLKLSLLYQPTI